MFDLPNRKKGIYCLCVCVGPEIERERDRQRERGGREKERERGRGCVSGRVCVQGDWSEVVWGVLVVVWG